LPLTQVGRGRALRPVIASTARSDPLRTTHLRQGDRATRAWRRRSARARSCQPTARHRADAAGQALLPDTSWMTTAPAMRRSGGPLYLLNWSRSPIDPNVPFRAAGDQARPFLARGPCFHVEVRFLRFVWPPICEGSVDRIDSRLQALGTSLASRHKTRLIQAAQGWSASGSLTPRTLTGRRSINFLRSEHSWAIPRFTVQQHSDNHIAQARVLKFKQAKAAI
jgi:hypothetical protein